MDIPDLVQRALGGEEIQAGVSLGDEDAVCFTPTRALVYKGEGLISDEGVEEFPLDTERLAVKRSRRKTKFRLQYIEGPRSFTVPSNRGEDVLERLLEGVFRVESVVDPDESVVGVYLFSELTLVVAEKRVVKHIGEAVWDEDFEVYDFADVTGLDFERTSVATSIVLEVDGYPQRVKVPSDNGPIVRQTLENTLFDFHDVDSLDELNRVLGPDDESDDTIGTDAAGEAGEADDLTFGSGIDPLVTDSDSDPAKGVEDPFAAGADDETDDEGPTLAEPALEPSDGDDVESTDAEGEGETGPSSERAQGASDAIEQTDGVTEGGVDGTETRDPLVDTGEHTAATTDVTVGQTGVAAADVATREEVEAVAEQLEELTDAVDRQNELLKRQHRAMKQLVERLDDE